MKHLLLTTIAAVVLVGCGKAGNPVADRALIHAANLGGNIEAVKQAIADGADVNAKNNDGVTPLLLATTWDYKEIVELLIGEGADVNEWDDIGSTPLLVAARKGHKEIAELLIDNGADVNAKDEIGETPLDYAEGETADLLRKHGGKTGEELN